MKLSLQSYFDLGASFGLADDAFRQSQTTLVPDIAGTGIRNPLGQGILCDLKTTAPNIVRRWKEKAKEKVNVPEIELGHVEAPHGLHNHDETAFAQFKDDLIECIESHPIDRCELTIYAIGTVFVRLDLGSGIPLRFLQAFRTCYEFAAYQVDVSKSLQEVARLTAADAAGGRGKALEALSGRRSMEIQTDARGYQEATLFNSFTCVGLCVDETDDVEAIREPFQKIEGKELQTLTFEYHGKLHFGWAACLLEPRTRPLKPEEALIEMTRMVECIQVAHVFLGTCEAFEKLFLLETIRQIDSYVKGRPIGRKWKDLNRLRTLALAVVSLTSYGPVAVADEDQAFFRCWEKYARIEIRQRRIQKQCDLLYNVEADEAQAEERKREWVLSRVILFLTALTFITVVTDSFGFVHHEEGWLASWPHRLAILGGILAALAVVLMVLLHYMGKMSRRE
jgi:hypothetical protein